MVLFFIFDLFESVTMSLYTYRRLYLHFCA